MRSETIWVLIFCPVAYSAPPAISLHTHAQLLAIRAWCNGDSDIRLLVEDWLSKPWEYGSRRKMLYQELVGNHRLGFGDPREQFEFYKDGSLSFSSRGHRQSWLALKDLNNIAIKSGLRGLVILFDEFEDVITNLHNIALL